MLVEFVRGRSPDRSGSGIVGSLGAAFVRVAPAGIPFVDAVVSVVIVVVLYLALVAWVLLVAPAQYFVYLVAGAPGREALASPRRLWLRVTPDEIQFRTDSKLDVVPEDASESGFSAKPVTFTASLAAVLLFALDQIV